MISTLVFIFWHYAGLSYIAPWTNQLYTFSYFGWIGFGLYCIVRLYGLRASILSHIHINLTVQLLNSYFEGFSPVSPWSYAVLIWYGLFSAYLARYFVNFESERA